MHTHKDGRTKISETPVPFCGTTGLPKYFIVPQSSSSNAVVTRKMKLFENNFEIISVFYFTRNHHI